MIAGKHAEKTLRMIRMVEGGQEPAYIAGSAHFFPYSFRTDISRYVQWADRVLLEGPLDPESMEKVAAAGRAEDSEGHLFDMLEPAAVQRLVRMLMPACLNRVPSFFLNIRRFRRADPVYDLVRAMKPWMAFFTLWGAFLRSRGWHNSVDMEIYNAALEMGKPIVFMETIEEQIQVLESIPVEKLIGFLENADKWEWYADQYVSHYLAGDLKKLLSITTGFPGRRWDVAEPRDRILYERMQPYLQQGRILACVGAPHLAGIDILLREQGFRVDCPGREL
ncbi:MAG: TraB/GumN family protein [Desulfobacteraceae bacterium]|nr:TraB/GumN family protein [Desulfobacteraceae bacterium]